MSVVEAAAAGVNNYTLTAKYTVDASTWPDHKVLAANQNPDIIVTSAILYGTPTQPEKDAFGANNLPTTDYIIDQTPWVEYGLSSQIPQPSNPSPSTPAHFNGYAVSPNHPVNLGGIYWYEFICDIANLVGPNNYILPDYRWYKILDTATNTELSITHIVQTVSYNPPANFGNTNVWPTPYRILYKNDL